MEVLQTSPLATWVRRQRVGSRTGIRRSCPGCLARRHRRGDRLRAGLALLLAALLVLLLPLLQRFHASFGFAPLTDVAFEGPSTCHDATSGREDHPTYPAGSAPPPPHPPPF